MPKSKKPRKPYSPRHLKDGVLPLKSKEERVTSTKVLMDLAALKEGKWDQKKGIELVIYLSETKTMMGNEDKEGLLVFLGAFRALNSMKRRYEKVGKWGATGDEIQALAFAINCSIDYRKLCKRSELAKAEEDTNTRLLNILKRGALDD